MSLASAVCRPVRGWRCSRCRRVYCVCSRSVSPLDTALGVAEGISSAPLMSVPEPDLSARYRLPASPGEPVDQVRVGRCLSHAIEGLDLDRAAHRLLVWADSWSAADRSALAGLIEAARTAGGVR